MRSLTVDPLDGQLFLDLWGTGSGRPPDPHQRGRIRLEWDTADGDKAGDLIPAYVCCVCGRPEPNRYWLDTGHGCCCYGVVRFRCEDGPRKVWAFHFAEEVRTEAAAMQAALDQLAESEVPR